MALSFNTGLTLIDPADSTTNWSAYKITAGGASPTATLDNSLYKEGTGALYIAPTASKDQGMVFDYFTANGTTLDLTAAGNEVIGIWILLLTPSIVTTLSAGGVYIILDADNGIPTSTGTGSQWAKWYISGSDVDKGGWQYFQIDTRTTPSATNGTWTSGSLAAIYRIGAGILASATTFHGVGSFYVDASWYGRPVYELTGDGTTVASWSDFLTDSTSNANGLVTDLGGAYQLACGVQLGNTAQTANTSFSDSSGKQVIFRRSTYYDTGNATIADSLSYSDYYVFNGRGTGTFPTSISLGTTVGTGDNRQGVLGGALRSADVANITWSADFQTNASTNLSSVGFNGFTFKGAKGGVLFDNNSSANMANVITSSFINCGEVDPGTTGNGATLLNCSLIDPEGGTTANRGLKWYGNINTKQLSCITSGSPAIQHMIELPDAGTYSTTFDAIKFFGDYSSANLWHGEISGANANVTINATNAANPSQTEFDTTGANSNVTVVNAVTVALHVQDSGQNPIANAAVGIYKTSDGSQILLTSTDGSGDASTAFNYSADTNIDIRIRKSSSGSTRYFPLDAAGTITSSGYSATFTMTRDTIAGT